MPSAFFWPCFRYPFPITVIILCVPRAHYFPLFTLLHSLSLSPLLFPLPVCLSALLAELPVGVNLWPAGEWLHLQQIVYEQQQQQQHAAARGTKTTTRNVDNIHLFVFVVCFVLICGAAAATAATATDETTTASWGAPRKVSSLNCTSYTPHAFTAPLYESLLLPWLPTLSPSFLSFSSLQFVRQNFNKPQKIPKSSNRSTPHTHTTTHTTHTLSSYTHTHNTKWQ